MSETWRRKKYYDKRVLVDVDRVLTPQYDDSFLCITGAQLEMLRNLTQYLRRRSTFVSAYHEEYYDAPSSSEWDDIQAIVADLEETLMGCTEMTDALLQMSSNLVCICKALQAAHAKTNIQDPGYTGQEYYDEYITPVIPDDGDPPGGFADWDEWRAYVCKGAQRLVDDARTSVLTIGTQMTTGILITFSLINMLLLLSVIAAPVSIVIQVVTTLVAIGANFIYQDVAAWLSEHKETLVCDIYSATSGPNAYQAAQATIAGEWDAGPGIQVVTAMFNREAISSIFDGTMRDSADWIGDYSEMYCEPCGEYPEGYTWTWTWPPCPAEVFLDGGVCWTGMLCFNGDIDDAHQKVVITLTTFSRIDWTILYKSSKGSGWTVGYATCQMWDDVNKEWDHVSTCTCTTTENAGVQNEQVFQDDFDPLPAGLYRIVLEGQAAQGDVEPYNFMVQSVAFTASLP